MRARRQPPPRPTSSRRSTLRPSGSRTWPKSSTRLRAGPRWRSASARLVSLHSDFDRLTSPKVLRPNHRVEVLAAVVPLGSPSPLRGGVWGGGAACERVADDLLHTIGVLKGRHGSK